MSEFAHCRIRRVRVKGGADITVLKRPEVTETGAKLMEHARGLAGAFGNQLAGFFILAWSADGGYSSCSRIPYEGNIPLTLFPAWVEEIARRELVTTRQIHSVMQDHYVIDPPRPPV